MTFETRGPKISHPSRHGLPGVRPSGASQPLGTEPVKPDLPLGPAHLPGFESQPSAHLIFPDLRVSDPKGPKTLEPGNTVRAPSRDRRPFQRPRTIRTSDSQESAPAEPRNTFELRAVTVRPSRTPRPSNFGLRRTPKSSSSETPSELRVVPLHRPPPRAQPLRRAAEPETTSGLETRLSTHSVFQTSRTPRPTRDLSHQTGEDLRERRPDPPHLQ